jgi:hypothetical protein
MQSMASRRRLSGHRASMPNRISSAVRWSLVQASRRGSGRLAGVEGSRLSADSGPCQASRRQGAPATSSKASRRQCRELGAARARGRLGPHHQPQGHRQGSGLPRLCLTDTTRGVEHRGSGLGQRGGKRHPPGRNTHQQQGGAGDRAQPVGWAVTATAISASFKRPRIVYCKQTGRALKSLHELCPVYPGC